MKSPAQLRHEALAKDVLLLTSWESPDWLDNERVKRACDALGWSPYHAKKWVEEQEL